MEPPRFAEGGIVRPPDYDTLARAARTAAWELRAQGRDEEALAALDRAAKISLGRNVYSADAQPEFRDPADELADARAAGEQGMALYRRHLRTNAAWWAQQHAVDPDLQTSAAVWAQLAVLPL